MLGKVTSSSCLETNGRMCCTFYLHLPMSKSHLSQYLGKVPDCVNPMVIKRKNIPAHETAPLFLYKPIKLATYSYLPDRAMMDLQIVTLQTMLLQSYTLCATLLLFDPKMELTLTVLEILGKTCEN